MRRAIYAQFPTAYADELRNKGQRQKARAFWEYCYDMEVGEHNSARFYAESWRVGKSTADRWVTEFKKQIDLYQAAWHLKNEAHYAYAQKSVGRVGHFKRDEWDSYEAQETGVCADGVGQMGHLERDKALNLNDDDSAGMREYFYWNDPKFNDLFFIYANNTTHPGSKEDAYDAFKKSGADVSMLTLAAVQYLHDPAHGKRRYNLANFLRNQAYLPYMPKMIRVTHDGGVIEGEYVEKRGGVFDGDGNMLARLAPDRLVALYKSGALEFVDAATLGHKTNIGG